MHGRRPGPPLKLSPWWIDWAIVSSTSFMQTRQPFNAARSSFPPSNRSFYNDYHPLCALLKGERNQVRPSKCMFFLDEYWGNIERNAYESTIIFIVVIPILVSVWTKMRKPPRHLEVAQGPFWNTSKVILSSILHVYWTGYYCVW
jgi:hypothetical protein